MQRAALGGQFGNDRGPIDTGQHLEHELRSCHQCTRVARAYASLCPPLVHEIDRDTHRRVLFLAHRIDR